MTVGERVVARKMAPIAVVTAIAAFSMPLADQARSMPLADQERSMPLAAAALLLWTVLIVATFLVPWGRLPRTLQLIVPLGYLVGVVLIREAEGGPVLGWPRSCWCPW